MQGFKIFFELLNTANDDQINLTQEGESYNYSFNVDGVDYKVIFWPSTAEAIGPMKPGSVLSYVLSVGEPLASHRFHSFEIFLMGPKGYALTNLGKSPTIYSHVVQAVKKFIEEVHPEAISFKGVNNQQSLMYAKFYNKYLKQYYTQTDYRTYIRNDIAQKLKLVAHDNQNDLKKLQQEKIMLRQQTINIKGKIVDFLAQPVYVYKIANGLPKGVTANLSSGKLIPIEINAVQHVKPIQNPNSSGQINPIQLKLLIQNLKSRNIPIVYFTS